MRKLREQAREAFFRKKEEEVILFVDGKVQTLIAMIMGEFGLDAETARGLICDSADQVPALVVYHPKMDMEG